MIELFHVSDLHFNRKKRAKELLAQIIKEFKIEKNANKLILITGDITDDGNAAQYKKAESALNPIVGNVRVVPGNHDYGTMGFIYSRKSAKYFDDVFLKEIKVKHKYLLKVPYCELLDDKSGNKLLIVGLNSCTQTEDWLDLAVGEIGDRQLLELEKILNKGEYVGIPKIVFLHHIPHRRAKGIGMSLKDYAKLMNIVREKVDVLAFGHQGTMGEVKAQELKEIKLAASDHEKILMVKKEALPINKMKLRSGKGQGIRYYLDANNSVEDYSCYQIKVEEGKISARIVRFEKK